MAAETAAEERVLVYSPTGRDAELICGVIERQTLSATACDTMEALCREVGHGAGAIVLAVEEALNASSRLDGLARCLADQPPWSDLPLIALSHGGFATQQILEKFESSGTLITLERPVVMATLISAVRSALSTRRRQYQLRDLLLQMQNTDRLKDEFLAMLSHELRNPLAPIVNTAVRLRGRTGDVPVVLQGLDVIERQAHHLTRLLEDLLDMSRVSQGKIQLRLAPTELQSIVGLAVDATAQQLAARELDLEVRLEPNAIHVQADAVRLQQVFTNLLTNAVKYTDPGGKVTLEAFGEGEEAVVRVCDTGVGVSEDFLPNMFELFSQSSRTLDRSQGGLGIGLTMVQRIVQMHGGSVSAQSDGPMKGTCFVVRLPRTRHAPPSSPASRHGNSEEAPGWAPRKILLVDDHVDGADAMAGLLEDWGYDVDVVHDGPAAIDRAASTPPDIVLLDIGLPGMDGYEVARKLREGATGSGVLLVAMTGYGQEEDRRRSQEAGFDHHLTKPVDLVVLRRLLECPGPGACPENGISVS